MPTPESAVGRLQLTEFFARPAQSHKYSLGHVLVIGGGPTTPGAPLMAATAALRTGAGLVTVATPDPLARLKGLDELMYLELPDSPAAAERAILDYIAGRRVSALVIGPGLDQKYAGIVPTILADTALPAVVDSGAFTPFHDDLARLTALASTATELVFTPHAGEFAKLSGWDAPITDPEKLEQATRFAAAHSVTLVYKDHRTIVARPDGSTTRNATGNPGMATAGSGDVLTGMIAGLFAQHFTASDAAEFGVYIHGLAGDLAAADLTQPALIATDLIAYLPKALGQVAATIRRSN